MIKKQIKKLMLLFLLALTFVNGGNVYPLCDHECDENCVIEDGECTHPCIDPLDIFHPED